MAFSRVLGASAPTSRYNSARKANQFTTSSPKRTSQWTGDKSMTAQERELAQLIVATLNLDMTAEDIDVEAPLYREGLGLDSIDILEIALEISKAYGFQLRSDDSDNVKIFSSLRSLSVHVEQRRAK